MKKNDEFEAQIIEINEQIKTFKTMSWIFIWVGVLVFIIGIFYWFVDKNNFNEVGDFIGGVAGSLWALAGLFFIYIAFLGQKVEIKYQQEDLTLTREELKETKEVFKQQTKVMINQQLDNTFFNLLENHRKVVESFSRRENSENSNELITGYEVLEEKRKSWELVFINFSEFKKHGILISLNTLNRIPLDLISIDKHIKLLYNEIMHLLDFIHTKIDSENKSFYILTLKNNLSENEKWLFDAFYYLINKKENHFKFDEFILSRYENLNYMPPLIKKGEESERLNLSRRLWVQYKKILLPADRPFDVNLLVINKNKVNNLKIDSINNLNSIDILKDFNLLNNKEFLDIIRLNDEYSLELILVLNFIEFKYCIKMRLDISNILSKQVNIYEIRIDNYEAISDYKNKILSS